MKPACALLLVLSLFACSDSDHMKLNHPTGDIFLCSDAKGYDPVLMLNTPIEPNVCTFQLCFDHPNLPPAESGCLYHCGQAELDRGLVVACPAQ